MFNIMSSTHRTLTLTLTLALLLWLFCSVLEMSMANWRDEMEHLGLDLRDGGRSLLDLRFADDILIFGADYHVIGVL